jgi:CubicO group peptidase (beta-lactamase class C family)
MNKKVLDHSIKYIDSWLELKYRKEEIPGFVVSISYKNNLILNKAYGLANIDKKIKLTPKHIFRIASHSKTFTATSLMQLQEQGKLRIDDYVTDYLTWLKKHKDKKWHKVTIRQLMSHGAGVIRDGTNSDFWQLERPFPDKNELKKEIFETDLVIDNNTKLKYSNFGYSLLGLLIEEVSGEAYNAYVLKHILKPLGLRDNIPEYSSNINSRLSMGYTSRNLTKTRLSIDNIDTRAMSSATGFYATAEDLCTYFNSQFIGSGKLLTDESKKEMQRVQWHANTPNQSNQEDYGLGIEIEHLKKRLTIGHGGGFPGYITKSIADPKDELVVVVLTNCHDGPAEIITKNIFSVIDYFQENTPETKLKHNLSNLGGRYMSLGSITDIIVTGDRVVSNYPNNWQPMNFLEKLEYINDHTLKIVDTNSFSNEGESVYFNLKNSKVESINYGGFTLWPEKTWQKKQKNRKSICLPKR